MAWDAHLALHYQRSPTGRCGVTHRHRGPLRVLQALYPEGDAICHQVVIHPPGGIVGGDRLGVELTLDGGTHALITTPGATRFYRCDDGAQALQTVRARVASGARLEWVPGETIAYSGCRARNALDIELESDAQALAWDVLALGLPAAQSPFAAGHFDQHLSLAGTWLERGRIAAEDRLLLDSPLGLAGRACVGSLAFLHGGAGWPDAMRETLLAAARAVIDGLPAADWRDPLAVLAGATAPRTQVVVVRVLGPLTEPVSQVLRAIRLAWREVAWGLQAAEPRVWAT